MRVQFYDGDSTAGITQHNRPEYYNLATGSSVGCRPPECVNDTCSVNEVSMRKKSGHVRYGL